jgi:hypothetical protein
MSDEKAFRETWERIVLYAKWRGGQYKEWAARKGHETGELEAWALINAVWVQIENGTAAWDPTSQSFYHFYCGRIHAHARNIARRVPRRDTVGEIDSTEINHEDPSSLRELLDGIERDDLLRFIESHNPKLNKMAILLLEGASKEEIELELGISDDTRVRWEKKLVALIQDHLCVPYYGVQAS